jgi:hypothetical protein
MSGYADFLATKARRVGTLGHEVEPGDVHPFLHDWQARIVTWAVRKGRAALWVDTGLGKTVMQLEWARLSGDRTLIVAPLAVCAQTVREAARIGIEAHYAQNDAQAAGPGVWVTNYERVAAFDPKDLDAVVLDEASILKQSDGKTRRLLITHFESVPYRLTCTATPAPNDVEELTNQAEFLGVMPRAEMLAAYFVHDEKSWRVKGHARRPMFDWMATWALALRSPADLGYDATDYLLPTLDVRQHRLAVEIPPEDDELFAASIGGVGGRARVRKSSLDARVIRTAQLVNAEPAEPWLLWCGLNDEAVKLAAAIPGAVNVHGALTPEEKAEALLAFADGTIRVLITKTSIAGSGMNFQHCARMAFVGLSDSWEAYYQAIRRCWRYGQKRPVQVHIVISELEQSIASNVARKERDATRTTAELVAAMRPHWIEDAA